MSLIKSWNQVEAHKSKTGEFPSTPGADHDLYLTWIKQCDARKAHALVLSQTDKSSQNRLNELLKIRALLFRGQLSQADAEIQNLQKLDSDPELQGEALLEQARLAAFQGDWSLAYSLSKTALGSRNLEALSRLSTLQVHALASFELGNLLEAVSALNIAEALTELFPFSISALYAKVLRARIAAREEGVQTGLNRLVQLWDAIRSSSRVPTADEVHTLIFGELDILKFERLNQNRTGSSTPLPIVLSKTCLASFHMTEAMGEQLYSALAALDSAVCADPKLREWFLTRLNQCRAEFKRIDRLIPEVLEQTTASSLIP